MVISGERTTAAETITDFAGSKVFGERTLYVIVSANITTVLLALSTVSPSGPGRSGSTAACAEHRKQRIRAHHGESRRQRRALEEFRGGVLSYVDTGDPLSRQPFLNGDARAKG